MSGGLVSGRSRLLAAAFALTASCVASPAAAAPFQLLYNGVFSTANALNLASQSSPTFFGSPTPFALNAFFDTSTPNLAPPFGGPFDGFRAYAPSLVRLTVGGVDYTVDSIATNPTRGVSIAIFDRNSFEPGFYGIGIIQDPFNDGAGFVGDFASASSNFVVSALTSTTFTGYRGVGYSSGVCASGQPPACPHVVTPLVLRSNAGQVFNLTLGSYAEDAPPGAVNAAQLQAVPEPGTLGLTAVGVLSVGVRVRRGGCEILRSGVPRVLVYSSVRGARSTDIMLFSTVSGGHSIRIRPSNRREAGSLVSGLAMKERP